MKPVLLFVVAVCLSLGSSAQSLIKLYLKQIALNQVYIEYLQKGYRIVKAGWNTIGDIKQGHFTLDKAFFDGLSTINPKIRRYAKVADLLALQVQVVKRVAKARRELQGSALFSEGERRYVEQVFAVLLEDVDAVAGVLIDLVTRDSFKMSDDERIQHIDALYEGVRQQYVFVNEFTGQLQVLQWQKAKEAEDVRVLSALGKP